jgi:preprotein translocase subunit SecE
MDGSTLMIIAMVAMMALMCGGMLFGGGWAIFRNRRRRGDD